MMAAAESMLIRAYLDWQSEMGGDEVILPHPLAKRGPGFAAAADSSANPLMAGRHADADRHAAPGPMAATSGQSGQSQAGKPQPGHPPETLQPRPAGGNTGSDLYASLAQALNKSQDSRTGEAGIAGPGRAPVRGPEALSLPVFAGLEAFWEHLERTPGLVSGDFAGGASVAAIPGDGAKTQSDAKSARPGMIRGYGPAKAPLALVGFDPGEADIAERRPFQGEPGALLEKMMRAIRLDTRELYQTLLIKVRVSGKAWSRRELIRVVPLLHAELGLAQVPMVLLFGQECAQAVLKTGKTLDELRQETHRMEGREFFVTYHPAELLRKEELKRKAWEDLQWLQRRMAQENAQART